MRVFSFTGPHAQSASIHGGERVSNAQASADAPDEIDTQADSRFFVNSFTFALSKVGVLSLFSFFLLCNCGKKPTLHANESSPVTVLSQPKPDVSSAIVDEFIVHPVSISALYWKNIPKPEMVIPSLLQKLAEGPKDTDRGHAVANLADYATGLSSEKQAQRVTREIMDKMVMPHLALTKLLHVTSSHSWKKTVLRCVTVYKRLNIPESEKTCILILQQEAPLPEDRELATYMLAYWHSTQKDYPAAVTTIQSLPPTSKWADRKGVLVTAWKKIQNQKPKPAAPVTPTPPKFPTQ